MKFKVFIMSALLTFSFLIIGCGKDAELTEYEANVTAFIDSVAEIKLRMEEIDVNSDSAIVDTLMCLDENAGAVLFPCRNGCTNRICKHRIIGR